MTDLALYPIMNEIRNNMLAIGIKCSKRIVDIKFTGQRKTWGRCYKSPDSDTYRITVSDVLGKKGVDPNALKSVMAHELLHTCPECWCHTGEFLRLAEILEEKYGYKIKEHSSKKLGIPEEVKYDEPYVIECSECGQKYGYNKRMRWFPYLEKCGCGNCQKRGTLEFVKGGNL